MRSDEILTAVREEGRLQSADADWTDARVWLKVTDTLLSCFGHPIIQGKSGAWLKQSTTTTTTGRSRYRMPVRSASGVSEWLSWNDGTPLPSYAIIGDQIVFSTAPSAGQELQFTYYLRPSTLVEHQVTAGRVTAVDTSARTVTVSSVPTDRGANTAVVTGDVVDVVHSTGWHELAIVGVAATLSGSVFTFPAGTDMTDVEVGDFVRADGETDWPCIPVDYHRALCLMTAARIHRTRAYFEKAAELEAEAEKDMARFSDVLAPRIKQERRTIVPRFGIFRGGARRGGSGNDTFGGYR